MKSLSSPDKTGRDSSRASYGQGQGQDKQSRNSRRTPRLPVIAQRDAEGTRSYKASPAKSQSNLSLTRGLTDTSIELGRLRALSSRLSPEKTPYQGTGEDDIVLPEDETSHQPGIGQTGSIHLPDVRIAVKPAKPLIPEKSKPDSVKSEGSVKANFSELHNGHADPVPKSDDALEPTGAMDRQTLDSAKQVRDSVNDELGNSGASSTLPNYHGTVINADDGLNHTIMPVYPAMNDLFGMTTRPGAGVHPRPKAGRTREPPKQLDKGPDERERESYFLLHHRTEGDSVPYPGFEIPSTPTAEELAEIERIEMEQIEAELAEEEKRHLEKLVAEGRVFDTDRSSKSLTDEDSVIISDTGSMTIRSISERKSFCRCPTEIRIVGSKQLCKHCGKVVGKHGLQSEHKSKSRSEFESEFPFSRSMGSTEVISRASRDRMLKDRKLVEHMRTRTISDEDYMDLESIIQDDDARYWSTEDDDVDETSHATTTSSLLRLRNAQPYPLVNPDVHKEVYIRALNEVKFREMNKSNETKFDELKRFRRPNVFSYYQLWPFAGKADGCGNNIGIRPDNSSINIKTKKGGLMKHIFGDVKPEDYYPGGSKSNLPRIVLDSLSTEDRSMTKSIDASVINSGKKIKRSGILFAE